MAAVGYVNSGIVASVNGESGEVDLDSEDVGAAPDGHTHAASDVTSGTLATARLDVGTGAGQVAAGSHNHDDRYYTEAEMAWGEWTPPAYEANAANNTSDGHSVTGSRVHAVLGLVQLRGVVDLSGTFNSGVKFATLPAGHRPPALVTLTNRTAGTGSGNTFLDVAADGAVSIRTNLGSGARVILDGVCFPL